MNWSSEHLRSAKVAAHHSKQRTCAYKMFFQSFPTLCTYEEIEVTHMINALRPSPSSIVAYCKTGKNSQLKEHMVASFPGPEEGEEKNRCLGMRLILFPCPEQWAATFCTLQMFRSPTLARNGLHHTPRLIIWIHSLVRKVTPHTLVYIVYIGTYPPFSQKLETIISGSSFAVWPFTWCSNWLPILFHRK